MRKKAFPLLRVGTLKTTRQCIIDVPTVKRAAE
jgi:hypothetical protein